MILDQNGQEIPDSTFKQLSNIASAVVSEVRIEYPKVIDSTMRGFMSSTYVRWAFNRILLQIGADIQNGKKVEDLDDLYIMNIQSVIVGEIRTLHDTFLKLLEVQDEHINKETGKIAEDLRSSTGKDGG